DRPWPTFAVRAYDARTLAAHAFAARTHAAHALTAHTLAANVRSAGTHLAGVLAAGILAAGTHVLCVLSLPVPRECVLVPTMRSPMEGMTLNTTTTVATAAATAKRGYADLKRLIRERGLIDRQPRFLMV